MPILCLLWKKVKKKLGTHSDNKGKADQMKREVYIDVRPDRYHRHDSKPSIQIYLTTDRSAILPLIGHLCSTFQQDIRIYPAASAVAIVHAATYNV